MGPRETQMDQATGGPHTHLQQFANAGRSVSYVRGGSPPVYLQDPRPIQHRDAQSTQLSTGVRVQCDPYVNIRALGDWGIGSSGAQLLALFGAFDLGI